MSDVKHAPGPWQTTKAYPDVVFSAIDDHGSIAEVNVARSDWTANALLLAAAPTMYDALKAAEWSGTTCGDGGPYGDVCPICGGEKAAGHEKGCQLAGAIAKAEGR
jgi:hypothetical protein